MDDTIYGVIACCFLIYWIYVKDPVSSEDTKLDENTRSNLIMATCAIGAYTLYKVYVTKGEGILSFGKMIAPSSDSQETITETSANGTTTVIKKQPNIPSGTVAVDNVIGTPHVLEGRNFFSSQTTNNPGEITAA